MKRSVHRLLVVASAVTAILAVVGFGAAQSQGPERTPSGEAFYYRFTREPHLIEAVYELTLEGPDAVGWRQMADTDEDGNVTRSEAISAMDRFRVDVRVFHETATRLDGHRPSNVQDESFDWRPGGIYPHDPNSITGPVEQSGEIGIAVHQTIMYPPQNGSTYLWIHETPSFVDADDETISVNVQRAGRLTEASGFQTVTEQDSRKIAGRVSPGEDVRVMFTDSLTPPAEFGLSHLAAAGAVVTCWVGLAGLAQRGRR